MHSTKKFHLLTYLPTFSSQHSHNRNKVCFRLRTGSPVSSSFISVEKCCIIFTNNLSITRDEECVLFFLKNRASTLQISNRMHLAFLTQSVMASMFRHRDSLDLLCFLRELWWPAGSGNLLQVKMRDLGINLTFFGGNGNLWDGMGSNTV